MRKYNSYLVKDVDGALEHQKDAKDSDKRSERAQEHPLALLGHVGAQLVLQDLPVRDGKRHYVYVCEV